MVNTPNHVTPGLVVQCASCAALYLTAAACRLCGGDAIEPGVPAPAGALVDAVYSKYADPGAPEPLLFLPRRPPETHPPVIRDSNDPVPDPVPGGRYGIWESPTGAWAAHPNGIAEWTGEGWLFTDPVCCMVVANMEYGQTFLYLEDPDAPSRGGWVRLAWGGGGAT